MTHRYLAACQRLAILVGAASLTAAVVVGQSPAGKASLKRPTATNPWTPPLTPDGHPDLQGVWFNDSATPLERPKVLAGRQFLTDEEVTELTKRAARLSQNGSDFAPGDLLFLTVWADVKQYKNPGATEGLDTVAERKFDNRTSLVVYSPDGRLPPRTPDGQQRENARAAAIFNTTAAGPEYLPEADRCISSAVPRVAAVSYFQIIQTQGYLVFLGELIHEARIIPLDGRPHLPESIRQWNGNSRGHWEGSTLVVDTTNFSTKSMFLGAAEHLHLTERFTRVALNLIHYEITLDDPTTWTKPWTAVIWLKHTHEKIYEVACHEGNYETMHGILAGARAEEKAGEEAAKGQK